MSSDSFGWDPSVVVRLTMLLSGFATPRAVQVAAGLGIGELLRDGARSTAELADATRTNPTVLEQLLQVLVAADVVLYENGSYRSTALSDHLALFDQPFTGEEVWRCWTELPAALHTGKPPFERLYGKAYSWARATIASETCAHCARRQGCQSRPLQHLRVGRPSRSLKLFPSKRRNPGKHQDPRSISADLRWTSAHRTRAQNVGG
jgi:hypothetical protein